MPLGDGEPQRLRFAPSLKDANRWLGIAAIYVAVAIIASQRAALDLGVSPIWLLGGLGLWVVLKFEAGAWPGVWVGAAVATIVTGVPIFAAFGIATAHTLEAIFGAWLLVQAGDIDESLDRLRQVVTLILAAGVSAIVGASIAITALCIGGLQPWARYGTLWTAWWLAETSGDLLVAPVLLTVPLWRRDRRGYGSLVEFAALEAIAVALSAVVFALRPSPLTVRYPLGYTIFPLVMWAGLRFAHPGAAVIGASVSSIAIWGAVHGTGPFGEGSATPPDARLMLLQIYAAVVAASGLVFGAAIADRNRAERLRETDHALTSILARQLDLKTTARSILNAVCDTLGWDVGVLWLVDEGEQVLEFVDSWQRNNRTDEFVADSRARQFQLGLGLPGRVWATARPAWISDVVADSNFPRFPAATRSGLHVGFGFPILAGRRVLGVIEFFAHEARAADAPVLTLMSAAGSQIGQFLDRARAQQRVIEGEALRSAIVESALDAVISIDADGRIIEFNPAAVETFGTSRAEAIGRELAEIIVPARLRYSHRQALKRCAQTGQSSILGKRIEMPALAADGREFPVELAITRVVGGPRPVFTAHLRDITERKRIEQERTELLAREHAARLQAESASRSKDEFLATVSHELRTPLTAILGWATMLRTHQFDPERLPQIYDRIFRNAAAQTNIVNELLDVSRIVTGRLRVELRRTDICDVARESLETIRPTAAAKGVKIESDIPGEGCVVSGDAARLQQVVWNLLSNGVKFTPAGGTVTLTVRRSASRVLIEVADQGIGIPAALLSRLFERFWQADSTTTRAHGGLGLGLALVRHLVELHGGEVAARSAGEGQGATFVVTLPAAGPDSGFDEPERSFGAKTGLARRDLEGLTILVVDDDPEARELFTTILEGQRARVVSAESASEALQELENRRVDVMTIDLGMPGQDGFWLLERIREDERSRGSPAVPAVAVTAYASHKDRERVLRAGFAGHIPKPVLPEELLSAVQRTVSRRAV